MPEPGDAGPIYRQAVDELNARPSDYDRIPSLDDARNLKGLDLLAQATSMSTHGPHAGSIEDMWQVAIEITKRAGGDRGCMGLIGPDSPPEAVKPGRLIVLETEGWAELDPVSKGAFESLLESLRAAGIMLLRRGEHPFVEALERSVANGRSVCGLSLIHI